MLRIVLKEKKYILSIAFGDYRKGGAGVAKVIIEHQKQFNDEGYGYIYIFPIKKLVCNDRVMLFCYHGVIVDGLFIGVYTIEKIIAALRGLYDEKKPIVEIHVHHLMFNSLSNIEKLLDSTGSTPIRMFLHDYYTVCNGYNLLKNNEIFCGINGISEEKCKDCCYYRASEKSLPTIKKLINSNKNRITIISPSEITKQIWLLSYSSFSEKVLVVPHQVFAKTSMDTRLSAEPLKRKIRVAFLGKSGIHKGWNEWNNVIDLADKNRFAFYILNNENKHYANMKTVYVNVTPEHLTAMTDALIEHQIDVVFLWSICPETYSYAYFESLCATAFVITGKNSGNIAYQTKKLKNGIVAEYEGEVYDLFANVDKLTEAISKYRRETLYHPEYMIPNSKIVELVNEQEHTPECISYIREPLFNKWILPVIRVSVKKLYNK